MTEVFFLPRKRIVAPNRLKNGQKLFFLTVLWGGGGLCESSIRRHPQSPKLTDRGVGYFDLTAIQANPPHLEFGYPPKKCLKTFFRRFGAKKKIFFCYKMTQKTWSFFGTVWTQLRVRQKRLPPVFVFFLSGGLRPPEPPRTPCPGNYRSPYPILKYR